MTGLMSGSLNIPRNNRFMTQSTENTEKQPINDPQAIAGHSWSGIICSHSGDIDALICGECLEKFPFRAGLTKISDIMGCLDRKCALCGVEVKESLK